MVDAVASTNLTAAQLRGEDPIPLHEGGGRKRYVFGEDLVWPQLIPFLGTRMYEFHEWYKGDASLKGTQMFAFGITRELYQSPADVWIDFEDIQFLYQQDALAKCLISAWVL